MPAEMFDFEKTEKLAGGAIIITQSKQKRAR
jgi:hypothetical protein